MKLGIIGKGFVGSAVEFGFSPNVGCDAEVRTYDKDPNRSTHTLEETVNESDFIFLSVPTPSNIDGSIHLGILESALLDINSVYDNNAIILIRSTVTPGTTRKLQRKFKDFMTKQNIKDGNSIKLSATSNMIENLRANKLDEINTKVKSIIWGNELESKIATNELEAIYKDAKTVEIFGDKLDDMIRSTQRDIAFYGYKNVPLDQRDKALEEAKKDTRLQIDDVQKLITSFNVKKTSIDHKNRSNVTTMVENVKKGFPLSQADYENAVNIAINTEDQITLNKLEQLAKDANIYAQLATMSVGEIENRKNILLEFQKTKGSLSLDDTNNLRITTEYLSKLTSDLNKDQLMTANERNIGVSIQDIGFEKLLTGELKPEDFTEKVKQRIGNAYAVANHYKRDVVFFTNNEKKAIQAAYQQADTPDQIIKLTTALVQSFGMESDKAFAQFSKEDSFFAHIGGLVMQTGGAGDNVKLAVEGFLLMQGEENKKIYSVKNEDRASVVDEYSSAFLMNRDTQNSTIEAANYIYAAQLKNAGNLVLIVLTHLLMRKHLKWQRVQLM